jgi:hypothetical protein
MLVNGAGFQTETLPAPQFPPPARPGAAGMSGPGGSTVSAAAHAAPRQLGAMRPSVGK